MGRYARMTRLFKSRIQQRCSSRLLVIGSLYAPHGRAGYLKNCELLRPKRGHKDIQNRLVVDLKVLFDLVPSHHENIVGL